MVSTSPPESMMMPLPARSVPSARAVTASPGNHGRHPHRAVRQVLDLRLGEGGGRKRQRQKT